MLLSVAAEFFMQDVTTDLQLDVEQLLGEHCSDRVIVSLSSGIPLEDQESRHDPLVNVFTEY